MRYAVILAGGSGTRLWPMSRERQPKQLIPFIEGRSLLQLAVDRLSGFLEPSNIYICAAEKHRSAILEALPEIGEDQFIGEPMGRDTLNAVGLSSAIIAGRDTDATLSVFTADHLIKPVDIFQHIVDRGFRLAEHSPDTLVTYGITPTHPATGFGYLELGEAYAEGSYPVTQFREKPDEDSAQRFFADGPEKYLWNSGMYTWKAAALLNCLRRYEPDVFTKITQIAEAWNGAKRESILAEIYPALKKISIDYAIMEPASRDTHVRVAALPMTLDWLDVGSWPSFGKTCGHDEYGNTLGAHKCVVKDSENNLIASSDPNHLITAIGCRDMIIIHTEDATLVCRADKAENIKQLHNMIREKYGDVYL